jgi:hypothetical protein
VERFLLFASQSHHKYKENIFFSGQVNASVIVSLFSASGSFNQLVIVHATGVRIVPF